MIQIRKANINDIDNILNIANSYEETRLTYKQLLNDLENDIYKIFIIQEYDVIGYLYICQAIDSIDIISIALANNYLNKGYGSKLLQYLITYCYSKNIKDLFLEVDSTNFKAINCYIKNGFKQISLRRHYYKNGNDALIMKKEIV